MSSCRWNGSSNPRIVKDRHEDQCANEECVGCQPCTEAHCRVCAKAHATGTCAECLALARESLHEIARMCDALPAEVEHRGIDGEAMVLLGPSCDPEARGHLEASVLAGRVPTDYLDAADDARHPLFVLGSWDSVWRDALEHEEPRERLTVSTAVDYLDRQLTYMAGFEHVPFRDFARDLRTCRSHLESVLNDGEQVDTGAPCMTCRERLRRVWNGDELPWEHRDGSIPLATEDCWACARCHEWRSDEDYRRNVAQLHRKEATHLTDHDMQLRTGVKATTVRSWARTERDGTPPKVTRRVDSGRTLYAVADVLRVATEKGLLAEPPKVTIDSA